MKKLFRTFSWRNFLEKTFFFFFIFFITRLLANLLEDQFSLDWMNARSLLLFLLVSVIIGLVSSKTWKSAELIKENEPVKFKSLVHALFHYLIVALVVSVLCGLALAFILFLQFVFIKSISGSNAVSILPWYKLFVVSFIIGSCFSIYSALKNHFDNKRKSDKA